MTKLLRWIEREPLAVLFFLVGILIGVLFTLPIVPYVLPDGAANILGAATGAGIAVASALWMNKQRERRHTWRLNIAAQSVISELIERAKVCLEIVTSLDGTLTPMNSLQRYKFEYLDESGIKTLRDLRELKPSFSQNPGDLLIYVHLRNGVQNVLRASKNIAENDGALNEYHSQLQHREANPNVRHPPTTAVMRHSKGELNLKLRDLEFYLQQVGSW